jgi:hypothetical protein
MGGTLTMASGCVRPTIWCDWLARIDVVSNSLGAFGIGSPSPSCLGRFLLTLGPRQSRSGVCLDRGRNRGGR